MFGSRRRLPMDQCCALWASISMLAGEQFLTFRVRSQLLLTARRVTGVEQLDGLPHRDGLCAQGDGLPPASVTSRCSASSQRPCCLAWPPMVFRSRWDLETSCAAARVGPRTRAVRLGYRRTGATSCCPSGQLGRGCAHHRHNTVISRHLQCVEDRVEHLIGLGVDVTPVGAAFFR